MARGGAGASGRRGLVPGSPLGPAHSHGVATQVPSRPDSRASLAAARASLASSPRASPPPRRGRPSVADVWRNGVRAARGAQGTRAAGCVVPGAAGGRASRRPAARAAPRSAAGRRSGSRAATRGGRRRRAAGRAALAARDRPRSRSRWRAGERSRGSLRGLAGDAGLTRGDTHVDGRGGGPRVRPREALGQSALAAAAGVGSVSAAIRWIPRRAGGSPRRAGHLDRATEEGERREDARLGALARARKKTGSSLAAAEAREAKALAELEAKVKSLARGKTKSGRSAVRKALGR